MPVSHRVQGGLKTIIQCYPNSCDTALGTAGMTTNSRDNISRYVSESDNEETILEATCGFNSILAES